MVIVSYLYKETLLFLILRPNRLLESEVDPYSFYFIFTNVTEIFSVYLQLIVFLSTQVVFIYFLYHCFSFLSLALFSWEYYLYTLFLKLSLTVWCLSVILTNYVLIPLTWDFFFSFQKLASDQFMSLHFEAKLNEYLNFYISLYHLCILYCQIFTIIMFFLSFINSNFTTIKKFRKLYYYAFVLFSTLVSPPDIMSQLGISLFLIFIYEVLVFSFMTKVFLTKRLEKNL
jgi:sec-independent protein translocase protein TatC